MAQKSMHIAINARNFDRALCMKQAFRKTNRNNGSRLIVTAMAEEELGKVDPVLTQCRNRTTTKLFVSIASISRVSIASLW